MQTENIGFLKAICCLFMLCGLCCTEAERQACFERRHGDNDGWDAYGL